MFINIFDKNPKVNSLFQIALGLQFIALSFRQEMNLEYVKLILGLILLLWGSYNFFVRFKDKEILANKNIAYFCFILALIVLYQIFGKKTYEISVLSNILSVISSLIFIYTGIILFRTNK